VNKGNELPGGWAWATLDDLGRWSGGGTPSKADARFWAGGDVPWVSPKDMKSFRILDTEDHITPAALDKTITTLCPQGTVLIVVRSGILQRTLPIAIAQVPVTMNQDMKGITCVAGVSPDYLAYYLIAAERDVLSRCSKDGTTVASIESEALRSYSIPLAPTHEQRRIVAAIEQQFTRLDAGVAALRRVRAALKRYRAAVLKAAVEGKLTEAWRAEHPNVEPAAALCHFMGDTAPRDRGQTAPPHHGQSAPPGRLPEQGYV
jgi:type I restriction enzyme S subunit